MSNNIVLFIITLLVLSVNAKQLHTAQKSSKIIESETASSNQSLLVGGVSTVLPAAI